MARKTKTVSAGAGAVRVIGLKELRRDLRNWDAKAPRLISQANKDLAQNVTTKAQTKARALGGVAAKSATALKASGTLTGAAVRLDAGPRSPYAFGAEFGAYLPQFKPWRGNRADAGYFLYPTIREMSDEIQETYLNDVVDELKKHAFPEGI